ncbi:MAG: diguanylate cyclase [Betaproteobacteria bacterium]|nr:diguanylate cyclase [Betaproteobacteria bacterium]
MSICAAPAKGHILVVDDIQESLKLLATLLAAAGYRVRAADSGELALALVAASLPELILLDLGLAGMGGLDVMRRLKEQRESWDIPVVLLSAAREIEPRVECLKLGAVDCVARPFQGEELLARVQSQLTSRRARAALEAEASALRLANARLHAEIAECRREAEAVREARTFSSTSKLQRSDDHLAAAQRIAHVGSWEQDHVTSEGSWSAEALRIFGHDPASFVPSFATFFATVHPDDRDLLNQGLGRLIRENTSYDVEHRLLMRDGSIKHVHEQCSTTFDGTGRPLRTVGTVQDITSRIRAEAQIKLFRTLIDSAPDEIHVVDPATLRIIDANESAWGKLGYTREELLALHPQDIDTSDPETHRTAGAPPLNDGAATFETCHRRKDGGTFPVEVMIRYITLDRPYALAIARDITERRRADGEVQKLQAQLRDQAVRDPLTRLYNRRYVDEAMERELTRAARDQRPMAIVMCDIDHFKFVNDTHGHLAGDEVLRVFAGSLRSCARDSDIACRFGGEEFLLLMPDMPSAVAYQRAEQLRTTLAAARITAGTAEIQVTASFGVVAYPENGETMDELIRAADVAMYEAKLAGRDRVVMGPIRTASSASAGSATTRAGVADQCAVRSTDMSLRV